MAICCATLYPFVFPPISKRLPLDNLNFLVTTLRNKYKKFAFILVDEDESLAISYGFMKTFHNMNIIVQTTGVDTSSLNGKSEIPNNTLDNITRALLLNSSHKKELWCFSYQYAICLSRQNNNIFRGRVPYLLWHGTRPSYKHIKIWGVIVYTINGRFTRNNLDDRPHQGYIMRYADTTGVIIYWNFRYVV